MPYSLSHPDPSDTELRVFSSLHAPLGPEGAFQNLFAALTQGAVTLQDLWLLRDGAGTVYAAMHLKPYPMQPTWWLGALRTIPDIPDEAVTTLLTQVLGLSQEGKPIHLVYNTEVAQDFGAPPADCGWHGGDDPGISYRTDLSERNDPAPDPKAASLPLDDLLSNAFRRFYEPIHEAAGETSDVCPFEVVAQNLHELANRDEGQGQLYAPN